MIHALRSECRSYMYVREWELRKAFSRSLINRWFWFAEKLEIILRFSLRYGDDRKWKKRLPSIRCNYYSSYKTGAVTKENGPFHTFFKCYLLKVLITSNASCKNISTFSPVRSVTSPVKKLHFSISNNNVFIHILEAFNKETVWWQWATIYSSFKMPCPRQQTMFLTRFSTSSNYLEITCRYTSKNSSTVFSFLTFHIERMFPCTKCID